MLLFTGQSDEFKGAVSRTGRELLHIAYLTLDPHQLAVNDFLDAAHGLHLAETARLYLDGGKSQEALLSRIGDLRGQLMDAAQRLEF